MKKLLLLIILMLIITSCAPNDSIDNYKGSIIVYKSTYKAPYDGTYYNIFRIKYYNNDDKRYTIGIIKCIDGSNFNIGDTIK